MENLSRAHTRLNMVKAADEVAAALERLRLAVQRADPRDRLVLADGFPFVNLHADVAHDVADAAQATTLWAGALHANPRFEQLGTRRFPDAQHETTVRLRPDPR